MKKNKLRIVIVSVFFTISLSLVAFGGEWKQEETSWWYQNDDGSHKQNEWFAEVESGSTYYFDTFGNMRTGLSYIENKWYNFRDDGSLIYNFYSPDSTHISTNEGIVVLPDTPGVILGVFSGVTENKVAIGFLVTNMRNVPITVGSTCQIFDADFHTNFYLYDLERNGFIDTTVIQPGESRSLMYVAPDVHPINVKAGVTTARYDILCEDEIYWIETPIYNLNSQEDSAYIEYIEA